MWILWLSCFPCGPPGLCTLLHSVPRLQSKGSYFCSLGALEAAGLSKVILQLIWRLCCAAVVVPGRVSLGARDAGMKTSFLKCPGAEGGHPKTLFTSEMIELLLSSSSAGSHRSVLRPCAGSPSRPMPASGDRQLCGSGTVTMSTTLFLG